MSLQHSPTLDPRQILCWRSDLGITPTEDADGPCFHVEDPGRGKFFRIGKAEFSLLTRFDGRQTWQEVFQGANRGLDNDRFSEPEACSVTLWALQNGLLLNQASPSLSNVAASTQPNQATPWSLLSIRIPLGSPDRLCERVLPWVDWLFRTPVFVAWLLLVAAALYEVAVDWQRFVAATSQIFVPENWLTLGAAWLVLKVIHEAAHALVCKRHGGEVRQVGIAFLLFAPVAFVDVTSCWRFRSHWHRIQTAAAGIYVELAAAALAVLAASRIESLEWKHFLDNVAVMASITTLLFNLNPLSRFDGYYILSDLCQMANLYARGRRATKQLAARCFFGRSAADEPTSWLLAGYGFATMLWGLTVLVGLIVAASWYWHGLGLILSVSILLSWCLGWLRRARPSLHSFTSRPGHARRRFAVRTLLLSVACAVTLAIAPWPFVTTAPGVVEFTPLSVVRTDSSGFVQRVLVHDGETVVAEQPLLELRNDNLERERQDLILEIEQSRLRERIAAERHDVAMCQIEQQQRDALQRRLAERQQQVDRLTLRAPISGVVISRQLAALEGSFVSEGRELLSIGDPTQREFVASIRQDDLLAASDAVERPVTVHLNGRGLVAGRIQRLNPKASITPEFLCLCAPLGGPLPVRSLPSDATARDTSSNFELLQPHFRLTVTLDLQAEGQPLAGELGWVSLGHHRTCGRELLSWLTHWISEHQRRT